MNVILILYPHMAFLVEKKNHIQLDTVKTMFLQLINHLR